MEDFYEILEPIGKGKYGIVKEGFNKSTKQKVAIKIVSKKELTLEYKVQIRKELDILKLCDHPNIVKFIEFFET